MLQAAALALLLLLSAGEALIHRGVSLIDRVPVFRFYNAQKCLTQVPGRGEVDECRLALAQAIKDLTIKRKAYKGGAPSSILELSSLQQLEDVVRGLGEDQLILVKYYGRACQQCKLLEPMYDSLPYAFRDRSLRFCRADVTGFPELVIPPPDPARFEGLDRSQGIDERLEGCPRCGGSGFMECDTCLGKGYVVREAAGHAVADMCPKCVSHKKVPCPQCGGKCYLC